MNILLISPNYILNTENMYGGKFPPLGLLSIASMLIQEGHSVELIESNNYNQKDITKKISEINPDLIGFSVNSLTYASSLKVIQRVKELHPDVAIMIGGPHVTAEPGKVLSSGYIDFAIRGEGEQTCVELVKQLEDNQDIEKVLGISYRKNGKVVHNPVRPLISNLDSLPFPAYHLLGDISCYGIKRETNLKPVLTCMTSRGCPFACIFCCTKLATGRAGNWRGHSVGYVVNLIEYLIKVFGIKELSIQDDCFTYDMERVELICDELIKRGLDKKICWRAGNGTRADTVTKSLLKKMKNAGCYHIGYGMESGNQEILSKNGKGETLEQIRDAAVWSKQAGIRTNGSFIIGLYGDTEKTMHETIEFAKSLPLDQASFNIMQPYIGSVFYNIVKKRGRFLISPEDPEYYSCKKGAVFELGGCTANLMNRMQKIAYKKFYYRPSYIIRQLLWLRHFSNFKLLMNGLRAVLGYTKKEK